MMLLERRCFILFPSCVAVCTEEEGTTTLSIHITSLPVYSVSSEHTDNPGQFSFHWGELDRGQFESRNQGNLSPVSLDFLSNLFFFLLMIFLTLLLPMYMSYLRSEIFCTANTVLWTCVLKRCLISLCLVLDKKMNFHVVKNVALKIF